jgi:hypothetical protein
VSPKSVATKSGARKSGKAGAKTGAGGVVEPPAPPLLFVDAVEDGRARLLLGRDAFEVPAALLPRGAREGSWLRWSMEPAPAPPDDDQGSTLRAKLGRDDDGGDIDL